jgi:hypothetical protein
MPPRSRAQWRSRVEPSRSNDRYIRGDAWPSRYFLASHLCLQKSTSFCALNGKTPGYIQSSSRQSAEALSPVSHRFPALLVLTLELALRLLLPSSISAIASKRLVLFCFTVLVNARRSSLLSSDFSFHTPDNILSWEIQSSRRSMSAFCAWMVASRARRSSFSWAMSVLATFCSAAYLRFAVLYF